MQDNRSCETLHHGIDMLSESRVYKSNWRRNAKDNEPRVVSLETKKCIESLCFFCVPSRRREKRKLRLLLRSRRRWTAGLKITRPGNCPANSSGNERHMRLQCQTVTPLGCTDKRKLLFSRGDTMREGRKKINERRGKTSVYAVRWASKVLYRFVRYKSRGARSG